MTDGVIFGLIYLAVLTLLIPFALKYKPVSDRLLEYKTYLAIIETGMLKESSIVAACPMATYLPYLINKVLHIDKLVIFEITPCFFYALMPAFGYLTARLFFDIGNSVIASLFILAHFYFVYYPNNGRVSIAWGFMAGLIWALLSGHILIAALFVILLIVSHYGTSHYALYVLGCAWALMFLTGNRTVEYMNCSTVLVLLTTGIWFYFGFIAKSTGNVIKSFIREAVMFDSRTLQPAPAAPGRKQRTKLSWFLSLDSREPMLRSAFGAGLKQANTYQRLEFVISWLMVITLSFGVIVTCLHFDGLYRLLVIAAYSAILLTLAIPHISVYYGIYRVYFTSLAVLTPCFIYGINRIAETTGISQYAISLPLIGLYFVCVSGLIHRLSGIDKREYLKARIAAIWS